MAFLHEGVGFARIEEAIYDDTRPRGGILAVQVFCASDRDIDVLHLGFCGDMDRYDEQQEQQAAYNHIEIRFIHGDMQVVGLLDDIGEGNAEFERDEGVAVRCAAVFGIMVVAVVMLVVVVDGTHTPVTFYVPMG